MLVKILIVPFLVTVTRFTTKYNGIVLDFGVYVRNVPFLTSEISMAGFLSKMIECWRSETKWSMSLRFDRFSATVPSARRSFADAIPLANYMVVAVIERVQFNDLMTVVGSRYLTIPLKRMKVK